MKRDGYIQQRPSVLELNAKRIDVTLCIGRTSAPQQSRNNKSSPQTRPSGRRRLLAAAAVARLRRRLLLRQLAHKVQEGCVAEDILVPSLHHAQALVAQQRHEGGHVHRLPRAGWRLGFEGDKGLCQRRQGADNSTFLW